MMMLAAQGNARGQRYLEEIADLHSSRRMDIKPEMYDLWLECLIQTLREFDPLFDDKVERVWRSLMNRGIGLMKSKY
jgi:hemoglobin-like flavoprotein